MASITFAKIVANCELLRLNMEPMLAENPLLAPKHEELVAYLTEAKAVLARQSDLRGRKQEATRLRQEAEAKGQDLFSRLASLLRAELGFKNEHLLKFGIPPRKRVRRSRKEGPAPPNGTQPPVPTPAAPAPALTQAESADISAEASEQ
jgi:hypothetical protein